MTLSYSLTPVSSAPASIDFLQRSDEELDVLPFGVIALDREGVVIRYNRVEARLARLDRALVIGKNFFRKIAPCTATPEFEGRFREFIGDSSGPSRVRFQYVFNFRFGAQEVDIDFVRCSSPDFIYVCIGRRSFRRSQLRDAPGGELDAVALSELAPDESKKGVVRDPVERRNLVLDVSFVDALLSEYRRGEARTLEELGVAYGRRLAIDLEAEAFEALSGGLRELPVVTVMEMISRLVARQGWGALAVDLRPARAGLFTFTLERSALAEARGTGMRCGLVSGVLRALLSHVAQSPMTVREVQCAAVQGGECGFVATGARRQEAVADAITESGGTMPEVVRILSMRP